MIILLMAGLMIMSACRKLSNDKSLELKILDLEAKLLELTSVKAKNDNFKKWFGFDKATFANA
jgi:cell shape-determining protein MreC